MPRRPRVMLPNIPVHIIQRGNNRQVCFVEEVDYRSYLDWLTEYSKKFNCHIHAYVLMTNHVHLLVTADETQGIGQLMKALGQRYVQYFNRTYRRTGTLWEGRFRSCLVQDELYLLSCMRYIELNPVRAGMVDTPSDYPWCSYRANAEGEVSSVVTPHILYHQLGQDSQARQLAYRNLFLEFLAPGIVDRIRQSTNGNVVLGSDNFGLEIAELLGKRVTPGKPGRPKQQMLNEC